MDLELLEELVAFNEYGTLSATAEHLMITQPSVTRGMKQLEQELGVKLFNRQVNKITLNETGKLAAKEAKKIVEAENNFTEKVINFSKTKANIHIGSTAPGPLIWLKQNRKIFNKSLSFTNQLIKETNTISALTNYKERLIVTTQEINTKLIESMYLGIEHLYVKLSPNDPLASYNSVTLKTLTGNSFLVANEIGPWRKVLSQNIPNATFLYQTNVAALDEITHNSSFPTFRSNLTLNSHIPNRDNDNKIIIPVIGKNSSLIFYGSYLKKQRKNIQPLLKEIISIWTKAK
ncbi:LysR family transcriptional regulator [Lactobacillus sp. LL6]|nr:LysR family transcriptional regulator [Lactobacillus sp. LL6]